MFGDAIALYVANGKIRNSGEDKYGTVDLNESLYEPSTFEYQRKEALFWIFKDTG